MKKEVRNLPVALSEAELVERAKILGDLVVEITRKEEEKRATSKSLQKSIDVLKERQTELAMICVAGEELREIECEIAQNYKNDVVDVIRIDTGEVIESRPMRDSDRQDSLPIGRIPGRRKRSPKSVKLKVVKEHSDGSDNM